MKYKHYLRENADALYYNSLPSSIKTQLKFLKQLDIYTKKHIEDVPKHVSKICYEMGFDEEHTKFLMIAAYLHDVGKIFIKPEILQKPGKLTDEEYEIMKTHAIKGYDVCMSFDDLKQYAKIVRGHHENLDGTGYPDGLKGKAISLETSIVKVADVYSALANKRQYKDDFTVKQIFEIMYKEVEEGKMNGEIVYSLLMGIIREKTYEMQNIKVDMKAYEKQLEYNENILNCLEKYIKQKNSSEDILNKIALNINISKLKDFDINNIADANKLLIYINNNIINLTKNIKEYKQKKEKLEELESYAKKVMYKM